MSRNLSLGSGRPTLVGGLAGCVGAAGTLLLDGLLDPLIHIATGNARTLLAASFGAVVTVGAFSFWMRPIAAQLAVAALPPHLLASHLHDRFQARIIAATLGVLAFLAVTLVALPSAGEEPAPSVSTVVGVALSTGAVAALLLSMHQAERSLRPHSIIAETAQDVIRRVREASVDQPTIRAEPPDATHASIVAAASGWVTRIDIDRLLDEVPSGATVRLNTHVGAFAIGGWTEVALVWPITAIDAERCERISKSVQIGDQRSDAADLVGTLNRFVDIGIHAATASGAAPSTLEQVMSWLGAILHELIRHDAMGSPDVTTADRRTIVQDGVPAPAELAELVVEPLRRAIDSDRRQKAELMCVVADAEYAALQVGRHDIARTLRRELELTPR